MNKVKGEGVPDFVLMNALTRGTGNEYNIRICYREDDNIPNVIHIQTWNCKTEF